MKKSSFGANSFFSDLYSGTADFGKGYAYVVSVFAFIISALAVLLGVYFIRRKPDYTAQVAFTITKVTPEVITINQENNKPPVISTIYNLEGTVQMCGKNVIVLSGYQIPVNVGETIQVWMKPNCQSNEARYSSDDTTVIGWGIVIFAGIITVFNMLRLFFVRKYKGIAALQGASGISDLFRMFK
jgi:hypothetical protein